MLSPPRQTDQLNGWPELIFPDALPVSDRRDELARAIRNHPIVIVCGETGSGKTTQLPKICVLAGRGRHGLIGHTQPRRLAATTVARRIAEELGSPLGTHVGYKIRFQERLAKEARIKLMTDGILLAETQADPSLKAYDTLIIDEAHERSLNIDFLLGYIKRLLLGARRKDLRVIITSATIDAGRLAEHFTLPGVGPAPVFEISGRTYPVDIRYQPAPEGEELEQAAQIETVIEALWREAEGDVLVFLPGEREIRELADHLRAAVARAAHAGQRSGMGRVLGVAPVEILPLFARLSVADQQRVFSGASGRRIVLATNVAETSLTVPGIRYVIDSGMARVKRYRFRGKLEQLQIEAVSQASANQRAGRCGRVMHGICVRLYSEEDFNSRPRFSDPEILRVSLAGVLLRMKALKLGTINDFPFLDPPQAKAIADGLASLFELGALDEQGELTPLGRQLARLPLDPRIGRMLLAGHEFHCLQEVLIIASALSVQDPRERPMDQQQAADEQHRRFHDERSDFLSWIKLWDYAFPREAGQQHGVIDRPPNALRRQRERQFQREFINTRRLREWADVYQQLEQALAELDLNPKPFQGPEDAGFAAIHQALMTGLLGNLGFCSGESNQYSGTHETRFFIHPGSALQRKTPRWIMAAEVVDTSRVYARTVARVEPAWIERIGAHLLRRSWSDPHWEKKAAQIVAFERATIYGLILYAQRRVHHAHRDPILAREMLIREALVNLDWDSHLPFMQHNRRLVHEAQQLEQKMRRPDVLADQTMLYAWFDQRLPVDVITAKRLEQWWRKASQQDPDCLCLPREALLRKQIDGLEDERFPRSWRCRGLSLDLAYRFEPGASDDGVTLVIPLAALSQLDERQCEWLVPGLLEEKVLALMKSLPQRLRRNLVPLQAWVDRFMTRRQRDEQSLMTRRSLIDVLIEQAREDGGAMISAHDFRLEQLPRHLLMHFRLIDEHEAVLGMSRSLAELKSRFAVRGQSALQAAFQGLGLRDQSIPFKNRAASDEAIAETQQTAPAPAGRGDATLRFDASQRYQHWAFGSLPELMELEHDGQLLIGFPALVDHGDDVGLQVFDDLDAAQLAHEDGLMRLLAIHFREPLRFFLKQLPDGQRIEVLYSQWGSAKTLHKDLCFALLQRACLGVEKPRSAESFEDLCRSARPRLGLIGQELSRLLLTILSEYIQLTKRLAQAKSTPAQADIEQQLAFLLPKYFLKQTPPGQLGHLPRYLQAINQRLDRLRIDPQRDRELMAQLLVVEAPWRKLLLARRGRSDEKLTQFAWMLQELRVSLFAQTLKTPMPVSVKRLERWWQANAIR